MSLINDMLNDLENRNSRNDAIKLFSGVRTVNKKKTVFKFILKLGVTALLLLAIYETYCVYQFKHKKPTAVVNHPPENIKQLDAFIETSDGVTLTSLKHSIAEEEGVDNANLVATNQPSRSIRIASVKDGDSKFTRPEQAYQKTLALIEDGQLEKASKVLEDNIAIWQDYPPFIELEARILTMNGGTEEALLKMQESHPSIKKYPNYYALAANLMLKSERWGEAAEVYQALLHEQPNNGTWLLGLALAQEGLHDIRGAIHTYNQAKTTKLSGELKAVVKEHLATLLKMEDNYVA